MPAYKEGYFVQLKRTPPSYIVPVQKELQSVWVKEKNHKQKSEWNRWCDSLNLWLEHGEGKERDKSICSLLLGLFSLVFVAVVTTLNSVLLYQFLKL